MGDKRLAVIKELNGKDLRTLTKEELRAYLEQLGVEELKSLLAALSNEGLDAKIRTMSEKEIINEILKEKLIAEILDKREDLIADNTRGDGASRAIRRTHRTNDLLKEAAEEEEKRKAREEEEEEKRKARAREEEEKRKARTREAEGRNITRRGHGGRGR